MAKCKWCGKSFDLDDTRDVFMIETLLNYDNLAIRLCLECAINAIDDEVAGVYYETCEECGKRFDFIEEQSKFRYYPNDYGSLRDHWDDKIRCAECAVKKADMDFEEYKAENPEDFW